MANPIIRTIYLYLFALAGLIVLMFATYRMADVALRTFVFTKVDSGICRQFKPLPEPVDREIVEPVEAVVDEDCVTSERQRDLVGGLAGILVGLPVWSYHWIVIQRDKKKKIKKA